MSSKAYNITLQGQKSASYDAIRLTLEVLIAEYDYPLLIVEKLDASLTQLIYQEEVITFNHSDTAGINQMRALLPKINPKTGKICKCTNCKNCPSRILKTTAPTI